MSLLTNWGYLLTESYSLPNMLTTVEYEDFTAGRYASDARIEPNIDAASAAIRNYCGWHVYPSLACELNGYAYSGRVTRVRGGVQIQLPAKFVTAVESVSISGTAYTDFIFETNGMLKAFGVTEPIYEHTSINIRYTAGVPDELMGSIKELIAHRVTHALASSNGVQSETAGGVSITYSANWTNSARATALADDNKEVLAPYRIQGVF